MIIYLIFIVIFAFIVYTISILIFNRRRLKIENALSANYFIETLNNIIEENKYNLLEERMRLKKIDPYGNEDLKKWIGNPPLDHYNIQEDINSGSSKFKEGIPYFWEKVILKKFDGHIIFFNKWDSYCNVNPYINDEIKGYKRKLNKEDWFVFIASLIEKSCSKLIENNYNSKNRLNYKKGIIFENHCMQVLKSYGWNVKKTPSSGDQGVDLIASIEDLRICIQCKDHKKIVGNKAVREIAAGKSYWKGTHAILISKNGFTNSASKLAKANKVILINDFELNNLDNLLNKSKIK